MAVISVPRPDTLFFLSISSSIVLTRLSEPPLQTHCSEDLVAPGIEAGPLDL
jgi:hypothetical protein